MPLIKNTTGPKELEQKVAKMLFEFCGTTQAPNTDKDKVLTLLNDYQKALNKEVFIQSVEQFFKENSHVSYFVLDGEDEYNDEGGTVFYVSPVEVHFTAAYEKKHDENALEQEVERIKELVYNEEIKHDFLGKELLRSITPFKIHPDITLLRASIMERNEKKIFNAVQFYEKNMLEQEIPTPNKISSTKVKI